MDNILIICVNYYNDDETICFADHIKKCDQDDKIEIVIINNGSSDNGRGIRSNLERYSTIYIYTPKNNIGYYGAAYWGLKTYLQDHELSKFIIISNTDIEIREKNLFFKKLRDYHAEDKYAVIAPSIYSTKFGIDQNPHLKQRPTKVNAQKWVITSNNYYVYMCYYFLAKIKRVFKRLYLIISSRANDNNRPFEIYSPHGSFIIFKDIFFKRGGSLNYKSFLYGEEIFVAEECRENGLEVIYDPRISIIHKENSTTKFFKSKKIVKYINESNKINYEKYFK